MVPDIPDTAAPPQNPNRSIRRVLWPASAAVVAAAIPAGPPPNTIMSKVPRIPNLLYELGSKLSRYEPITTIPSSKA